MKLNQLSARVDELIGMGRKALNTSLSGNLAKGSVEPASMKGFRAASLSFIERVCGMEGTHYREFSENTKGLYVRDAEAGIGILEAIKSEIEGGWLFTVKGLVAAELFIDFLEMSEYLLREGYKDAAAVIIGSVLEEHLRQLCKNNSIDVEEPKSGKLVSKKADRLNADLAKASVYTALDQKMVTAWLDFRNKAAHGKYSEYAESQVQNMLSGVMEFMARVAV